MTWIAGVILGLVILAMWPEECARVWEMLVGSLAWCIDMLGELAAALIDSVKCGDLRGHLAAWAEMVAGVVDAEDRIYTGGRDGE